MKKWVYNVLIAFFSIVLVVSIGVVAKYYIEGGIQASRYQELSAMNSRLAALDAADYIKEAEDISGIKFITKEIKNAKGDDLRSICDEMRSLDSSVAALLISVNGEKTVLAATCGKDVVARGIKAGDMVRESAKTLGGNGGGKPDFAMAGANDSSKICEAMKTAREFVCAKA